MAILGYHVTKKKIQSNTLKAVNGKTHVTPTLGMTLAFINTNWNGRSLNLNFPSSIKKAMDKSCTDETYPQCMVKILPDIKSEYVVISESEPGWIETLNTSAWVSIIEADDLKIEFYNNGSQGNSGMDVYVPRDAKIIRKMFVPNVFEKMKELGVKFVYYNEKNKS